MAAEDHEDMELKRRLRPHIYGGRAKARDFSSDAAQDVVDQHAHAIPSNRVEAAIFDQVASAESETAEVVEGDAVVNAVAEAVTEGAKGVAAEGATVRGLVMVRCIPSGTTAADVLAFFSNGSLASPRLQVLGGVRGIHLAFPRAVGAAVSYTHLTLPTILLV